MYSVLGFDQWTLHSHLVKTCGTAVYKTTSELLFGIEFHGECYIFQGLTQLLENIHQAEEKKCYFGIGDSNYVSLHMWSDDN